MITLDQSIRDLELAILRAAEELTALEQRAKGSCCAACFHGAAYAKLVAKQERRLAWLSVLLGKRGGEGDEDRRQAIKTEVWP